MFAQQFPEGSLSARRKYNKSNILIENQQVSSGCCAPGG
jgi:hypothetical protein